MKKDLLTIADMTADKIGQLFELTEKLKRDRGNQAYKPLAGKSIGLIFAKSSTFCWASAEV